MRLCLQFTSRFCRLLQKWLGTKVKLRTTFHPQIGCQAERAIKLLEDMLSSCIIDLKGNWDEHLSLVSFSYNNSFTFISMALYEVLYDMR